jgi:hypothetical protein
VDAGLQIPPGAVAGQVYKHPIDRIDDLGARVLSSLADVLGDSLHAMLQILNARRPFTETVEGCLKIKNEIEAASRLRVTGLVSNTHLLEETDAHRTLLSIPGAGNLEILRESGHSPMIEVPAGLTELLITFIAEDWDDFDSIRKSVE